MRKTFFAIFALFLLGISFSAEPLLDAINLILGNPTLVYGVLVFLMVFIVASVAFQPHFGNIAFVVGILLSGLIVYAFLIHGMLSGELPQDVEVTQRLTYVFARIPSTIKLIISIAAFGLMILSLFTVKGSKKYVVSATACVVGIVFMLPFVDIWTIIASLAVIGFVVVLVLLSERF